MAKRCARRRFSADHGEVRRVRRRRRDDLSAQDVPVRPICMLPGAQRGLWGVRGGLFDASAGYLQGDPYAQHPLACPLLYLRDVPLRHLSAMSPAQHPNVCLCGAATQPFEAAWPGPGMCSTCVQPVPGEEDDRLPCRDMAFDLRKSSSGQEDGWCVHLVDLSWPGVVAEMDRVRCWVLKPNPPATNNPLPPTPPQPLTLNTPQPQGPQTPQETTTLNQPSRRVRGIWLQHSTPTGCPRQRAAAAQCPGDVCNNPELTPGL